MSSDNEETAQMSPEKMQLVMWEGKALATVGKAAEAELPVSFNEVWDKYCSENPIPPDLNIEGYDPHEQLRKTRAQAEVVYLENLDDR